MIVQTPPRAATALLDLFVPAEERDSIVTNAIAGDLLEEFQSRQSATWYWIQVWRSLGHLALLGMRRAPGRTIGAMLGGYAAMAAGVMLSMGVLPPTLRSEVISGFVCAIPGGYIAAAISRGSGVTGMLALCAFTSAMAILSLSFEPVLDEAALMSVFVMGTLAGGYLRARFQKEAR